MTQIPAIDFSGPKVLIAIGRLLALVAMASLCPVLSASPAMAQQGTWTPAPPEPVNGGPAFGLWLLTDGTVLSHSNALNHWCKLIPDATGSYANGTWVQLADSPWAMGGATEHVLNDGRFIETGGEYIYAEPPGYSSTDYNDVQIYDPVTDTWTIGAPGLYGDIGDSGSAMLANGDVFGSSRVTTATEIYSPITNTWSAAASMAWGTGDEAAWTSLPNGGVFAAEDSGSGVYDPATNTWTQFTIPSFFNPGDIGPTELLYDGRILCLGYESTAFFTPGATPSSGSWSPGPSYPGGPTEDAEDEYGCCEPDGKMMFAAYPVGEAPNELVEFDPATNTFSTITPPPDPVGPYPVSYCDLPNGQVMVCCGSQDWLYTPAGSPQDSWRPTVTGVVENSDGSYMLTGTQLSGLVNGWDEGDDMSGAENYPVVWLKAANGDVYFCKSYRFSNMMPSVGNAKETCRFTVPSGLPAAKYSLYVSSVGVASKTAYSLGTHHNFTLWPSPGSVSVDQGGSVASNIAVTESGGLSGSVSFTATSLPTGVTANFSSSSSSIGTTVTLSADSTATGGAHTVTITGVLGTLTRTATITLIVIPSTPPAPVAWWKFDKGSGATVFDSSGHNHTGTLTNGTWTKNAKQGPYAISFAGNGDMQATGPVIDTTASFTVACWGEMNNTSGYQDFITIDGDNVSGFYLQYNAGTGTIVFNRLTGDSDNAAAIIASATAAPAIGTWYYVVGVYDASALTISLYIDGVLQQTTSFTSPWKATGNTLVGRGKFSANPTDFLNGTVDSARIYNKALNSAQVATLYNSGG